MIMSKCGDWTLVAILMVKNIFFIYLCFEIKIWLLQDYI